MRNVIKPNDFDVVNNQKINTFINLRRNHIDIDENNPVFKLLVSEGELSFAEYLAERGLAGDPATIVLSARHHYYYDAEEIRNVSIVINLKKINHIKEIKSFLRSLFQILPQNSTFVGCFEDNRKLDVYEANEKERSLRYAAENNDHRENSIVSDIPFINLITGLLDIRTRKYISAGSVKAILAEHGFKVLNMKEIDGITYFHSQKPGSAYA